MYSYEARMKAVQLFIQYDYSSSAVIHELGYPSRGMLYYWYKEYIETGALRSDERTTYRNGSRTRMLATRVGSLILHVPKFRNGTLGADLFTSYQRSEQALLLSLMEMVIQGVSTRKISEITETLCGTSFPRSTVSALCEQ